MNYTIGNWTVESQTADSISTAKNMSIPDLDYGKDFAVTTNVPAEAVLANLTGPSVLSPEQVRYAITKIQNVYQNTQIPAIAQHKIKSGVRTLSELKLNLKAVNSVSGEEIEIPLKGWLCLAIPNASIVTKQAIDYLLARTVGSALDTGSVDSSREVSIARNDLVPD